MMKNQDLVSIIVPVYNVEPYLKRCVNSLISQTHENIEIVLINDGSTDGSKSIAGEFCSIDSRVRLINQENMGLAYVRNVGVKEARGKYLMFVDSDDYIDRRMTEILLKNLLETGAQISACGHQEIFENGYSNINTRSNVFKTYTAEEALRVFLFTYEIDVICCNKLYLRELFSGIEFPTGRLFEDHYTLYKVIERANKIVFDSKPLYYYCKRGDSIGGSLFTEKNMQLVDAISQEVDQISSLYPNVRKDLELALICWEFVVYDKMLLAKAINTDFESDLRNSVRNNVWFILTTSLIKKNRKAQLIVFVLNKSLYSYVYKKFIKKFRGATH